MAGTCLCACVPACLRAYVPAYLRACVPAFPHARVHACLHVACLRACVPALSCVRWRPDHTDVSQLHMDDSLLKLEPSEPKSMQSSKWTIFVFKSLMKLKPSETDTFKATDAWFSDWNLWYKFDAFWAWNDPSSTWTILHWNWRLLSLRASSIL